MVLLDDGRVAATGHHELLLATNERYREVLAALAQQDSDDEDGIDDGRDTRVVVGEGGGG